MIQGSIEKETLFDMLYRRNADGSGSEETGEQLLITSDMAKLTQPLTYECTASNQVNGQTYTVVLNVSFTVGEYC